MKVGGNLGSSDNENVELHIRKGGSRVASKTTTMDFRRAGARRIKDVLGRIPWKQALQGRGVQES